MNLLVSGTSSGIGRALVERLVGHGHTVWGLARSEQPAGPAAPGQFHPVRCDVAEWTQVGEAVANLGAPHLDGVVTCAGLQGEIGRALTADPARWSATVRANLDGTYYVLRACRPLLARAARRAKIVCFSGGGATKPRINFSAYAVAKTGVVRLVENIAQEEPALDINAIAPGAINTRLTDEVIRLGPAVVGEAEYAAALKQKQTGGASLPRALDLVEFLLSEKSDGITGRLLSAPWDPWGSLAPRAAELAASDIYTLRRIGPDDRGGFRGEKT